MAFFGGERVEVFEDTKTPNYPTIDEEEDDDIEEIYKITVEEAYPYTSYNEHHKHMGFDTKAIHCGNSAEPTTGAVNPPIYMSSTFSLTHPFENKGYLYTRVSNPNHKVVEQQLAALEGGEYSLVFSAGISSLASLGVDLHAGDVVLCLSSCYSGTYNLLNNVVALQKVEVVLLNVETLHENLEGVLDSKRPKYMFFESPTNPMMDMCDIKTVTNLAKQYNCITIFDNTFSTPYLLKPLQYGVDVVVYSATKYLAGHSDIIGGALVTNNKLMYQKALFYRSNLGMIPSPFDSWLLSRSIKTLSIRVERHSSNALTFAQYFDKHPLINKVYYPGLESHKYHEIAKKQFIHGYGGMMSIDINVKTFKRVYKFLQNLKLFSLAISLGGVESLINHSITMSHRSIPAEVQAEVGIGKTLLRVSIGLENVDDLIKDFEQALVAARS